MVLLWQTGIPPRIYAHLYCNWRRVRREVDILSRVFRKYRVRRLIEFGCGPGRHGYLLSRNGFQVLLTDIEDWRYGFARKLPFRELDILGDNVEDIGEFDGGYAVNFLVLFGYNDMVKALKNIGKILEKGIFIADYNFKLYGEPREIITGIYGKVYKAILEEEEVKPVENGLLYRYVVKVFDDENRVIGVESGSYFAYTEETVLRAISEAGFRVVDVVWVSWDPVRYLYEPRSSRSDSAFIVMKKY